MNTSLYFHIPFCVHRCAYCDFNTYAGQEFLIADYVRAVCREVDCIGANAPNDIVVHTIFFGGGTPSLLQPRQFEKILRTVDHAFCLRAVEITIEANPGTVTLDNLRDLHSLGINRLSFGVQSAHPETLHQLERIHNYYDVINSIQWARQAGFSNLNVDLIFGMPEQTLKNWQLTIDHILRLYPEHLSLYALTIEKGTPFGRWHQRGLMPSPDPDLTADMYELASKVLEDHGYYQYEISNWSKSDFRCLHNLQYWRDQPYLGFGAGAHGYAANIRYSNVLRVKNYLERMELNKYVPLKKRSRCQKKTFPLSPAAVAQEKVSTWAEMQEVMMLGLRLTREGISQGAFRERFGLEMEEIFSHEIKKLIRLGLLEWGKPDNQEQLKPDSILRLTQNGRFLANQVFLHFVGE